MPAELKDPATRRQRLPEAQARVEAERKRELATEKQAHVEQIEAAKQALEVEAREQARAAGQPTPEAARPAPKAQRNFTDPDSRIMKTPDGFQQCYNAQVAVDVGTELIVAGDVVDAPNDKQQLQPMVEQVIEDVGVPAGVIADRSIANTKALIGGADSPRGDLPGPVTPARWSWAVVDGDGRPPEEDAVHGPSGGQSVGAVKTRRAAGARRPLDDTAGRPPEKVTSA